MGVLIYGEGSILSAMFRRYSSFPGRATSRAKRRSRVAAGSVVRPVWTEPGWMIVLAGAES